MERLLLRVSEAAEALGKSRSAVYQLIAQGVLPAIRVGNSLRVPVAKLHQWIEEQLQASNGSKSELDSRKEMARERTGCTA